MGHTKPFKKCRNIKVFWGYSLKEKKVEIFFENIVENVEAQKPYLKTSKVFCEAL